MHCSVVRGEYWYKQKFKTPTGINAVLVCLSMALSFVRSLAQSLVVWIVFIAVAFQQMPKVGTKWRAISIPIISVPEMRGAMNPYSGQRARINTR